MTTNNITRLLESRKISYQTFPLPGEKITADQVARLLNAPPEIVFKSIVISRKGPGKPILAVVPGNRDVDLKKLARVVGEKKVVPATQAEAEKLTGLQAGGISPLALINRGFEILIHNTVLDQEELHISGGERGLNIRLSGRDLVDLVQGKIADIS
jgi:Cys-tRNA(Pro)/Cys-tRNA(Cys) deacylase